MEAGRPGTAPDADMSFGTDFGAGWASPAAGGGEGLFGVSGVAPGGSLTSLGRQSMYDEGMGLPSDLPGAARGLGMKPEEFSMELSRRVEDYRVMSASASGSGLFGLDGTTRPNASMSVSRSRQGGGGKSRRGSKGGRERYDKAASAYGGGKSSTSQLLGLSRSIRVEGDWGSTQMKKAHSNYRVPRGRTATVARSAPSLIERASMSGPSGGGRPGTGGSARPGTAGYLGGGSLSMSVDRGASILKRQTVTTTATTPGQPLFANTDPVLVVNCDEFVVRWRPPTLDGGFPVVAYRVKYSPVGTRGKLQSKSKNEAPGRTPVFHVQVDAKTRTASVRNLLPSTKYSIRLCSKNELGWGKSSTQAFVSTTLADPIPRFQVTQADTDAINLSWEVPGGFTDVEEVQIEYWCSSLSNVDMNVERDPLTGEIPKVNEVRISIDATKFSSCVLAPLQPGAVYSVRGRAVKRAPSHYDSSDPRYQALVNAGLIDLGRASKQCPWSIPLKHRTLSAAPDAPRVKIARPASVSVTVEWLEPRDNGEPVSGYDLEVCDALYRVSADGSRGNPAKALSARPAGAEGVEADLVSVEHLEGQRTFASIANIPAFTNHVGRVRAYNSIGTSEWCEYVSFCTLPSEEVPSRIELWTEREQISTNLIPVAWQKPKSVPGVRLDLYQLEYKVHEPHLKESTDWIQVTQAARASEWVLEGLVPGNICQFRCRAANINGIGQWSQVSEAPTLPVHPDQPMVIATKSESTQAVTYWNKPNPRGSEVTQYQLEYANVQAHREWKVVVDIEPFVKKVEKGVKARMSKLKMMAKDVGHATDGEAALKANQQHKQIELWSFEQHTVRVRALNGQGYSPWSELMHFKTDPSNAVCPKMAMGGGWQWASREGAPPRKGSGGTPSSLTVWWKVPPAVAGVVLQRYQVEYKTAAIGQWTAEGLKAKWKLRVQMATAAEGTFEGVDPGQWFDMKIRGKNANGFGEWSEVVTVQAQPIPPDACVIDDHNAEPYSIGVKMHPNRANGARIEKYEFEVTRLKDHLGRAICETMADHEKVGQEYVDHRDVPRPVVHVQTLDGHDEVSLEETREFRVPGCEPFEELRIRHRALNGAGWGEWSEGYHCKTMACPDAPDELDPYITAEDVLPEAQGVVVRWVEPPIVPGMVCSGYEVRWKLMGGVELLADDEWRTTGVEELAPLPENPLAQGRSCRVTLAPGMNALVMVAAKNGNGTGEFNDFYKTAKFQRDAPLIAMALPVPPETVAPPVCTASDATAGDAHCVFKWAKPAVMGAPVLEYEVSCIATKGDHSRVVGRIVETSARVMGLRPATEYLVSVRARNIAGWSKTGKTLKMPKTAASRATPGLIEFVGDLMEGEECTTSTVNCQWEVPTAESHGNDATRFQELLEGAPLQGYDIKYVEKGEMGGPEHFADEVVDRDYALEKVGWMHEKIKFERDPINAFEAMWGATNSQLRSIDTFYGKEYRDGLGPTLRAYSDGMLLAMFNQLLLADREERTALPNEAEAEADSRYMRAALKEDIGGVMGTPMRSNVEEGLKIEFAQKLCTMARAQFALLQRRYEADWGVTLYEDFEAMAAAGGVDMSFAMGMLRVLEPESACRDRVVQVKAIVDGEAEDLPLKRLAEITQVLSPLHPDDIRPSGARPAHPCFLDMFLKRYGEPFYGYPPSPGPCPTEPLAESWLQQGGYCGGALKEQAVGFLSPLICGLAEGLRGANNLTPNDERAKEDAAHLRKFIQGLEAQGEAPDVQLVEVSSPCGAALSALCPVTEEKPKGEQANYNTGVSFGGVDDGTCHGNPPSSKTGNAFRPKPSYQEGANFGLGGSVTGDATVVTLVMSLAEALAEAACRPYAQIDAAVAAYNAESGDLRKDLERNYANGAAGSELAGALLGALFCTPAAPDWLASTAPPDFVETVKGSGFKSEQVSRPQLKVKVKPGQRIAFYVAARNSNGLGLYHGPYPALAKSITPEPPIIKGFNPHSDTIDVEYEQKSSGGALVMSYDVDVNGKAHQNVTYTREPLGAVIMGLNPFKDYAIRIRAENKNGKSAWSTVKSCKTGLSHTAEAVRDAMFGNKEKGVVKDIFRAFEALWMVTNDEIKATCDAYKECFGQDLRFDMQKHTGGPFGLLMLMLLDGLRREYGTLRVRVEGARELYNGKTSSKLNPYAKVKLGEGATSDRRTRAGRNSEGEASWGQMMDLQMAGGASWSMEFGCIGGDNATYDGAVKSGLRKSRGKDKFAGKLVDVGPKLDNLPKDFELSVMDEDFMWSDDAVGKCRVNFEEVIEARGQPVERHVTLTGEGSDGTERSRGECHLVMQWKSGAADAGGDREAAGKAACEEWRKGTKVKLGTDFEMCTKVLLGFNLEQLQNMCEQYVVMYKSTPHDDLRDESFVKPSSKMWAAAALMIFPCEGSFKGSQPWPRGNKKKPMYR